MATHGNLHSVPDRLRGVHIEVARGHVASVVGPDFEGGAGLVLTAMPLATVGGEGLASELAARIELAACRAIGRKGIAISRVRDGRRSAVAVGQVPTAIGLVVNDGTATRPQQALALGTQGGAGFLRMNSEGDATAVRENAPSA